jgi:hypothetical protein
MVTPTLRQWNFGSELEDQLSPQINRQKSARNLVVETFDLVGQSGVFFDLKRKNTHTATLHGCDCGDFLRQRKVVRPCMHIYRLAAELGLLELTEMDRNLARVVDRERADGETQRLQSLLCSGDGWNYWPFEIHSSFVQLPRQWRAYQDAFVYKLVQRSGGFFLVNGWPTSLRKCTCPDFSMRRLPCKHIYAVALMESIPLPLTREEFDTAVKADEELVFHHWRRVSSRRFQIPEHSSSESSDKFGGGIKITLSFPES